MTTSPLVTSLDEVLQQGESLLSHLNDDRYTDKVPEAFNSSIGGHYRHALEHVGAVLANLYGKEINYSARLRDRTIETNRHFALEITRKYRADLSASDPEIVARPILVKDQASYSAADVIVASSTIGREMMYATLHAIHHYALIGIICGIRNMSLPEEFGIAPSTLRDSQARGVEVPACRAR